MPMGNDHVRHSRRLTAAMVISNAVASVTAQLFALVMLTSAAYGRFALLYMVFAFGISVALSGIAEAWTRRGAEEGTLAGWDEFSPPLIAVAAVFGLGGALVAVLAHGSALAAVAGAVAIALTIYRIGARFYEIRKGYLARSIVSDVLMIVGCSLTWIVVLALGGGRNLEVACAAWAAGSLLSVTPGFRPAAPTWSLVRDWFGNHRLQVRALLGESLLMDAASLGGPLALLPLLSISGFGMYRAASTVAAPVRLLLNPLRPLIARLSTASLLAKKMTVVLGGLAAIFALGAFAALELTPRTGLDLGTLGELFPYAIPIGIYVGGNLFGHFYYLVARTFGSQRRLLRQRVVQSVLVLIGPLIGALGFGLSGAFWGLAIATVLSSIGWLRVAGHPLAA